MKASILSCRKSSAALPALLLVGITLGFSDYAFAQQEFPPPQGKGRVVVLASGMSGPAHYEAVSREIAALGYDVVLFDGNAMENTNGEGVRTAIDQAMSMPHALPGKAAFVGFSLGGGMGLYYAVQEPEKVAGAILWYPANVFIRNVPGWVDKVKVPVLIFAGEKDNFRNGCCTAAKDAVLKDAGTAAGLDVQLFTYKNTDHDFVRGGDHFREDSYSDAFQRTAERLKHLLSQPAS